MAGEKGLIFDIQGFSVHDGPGCRTLVFLKGCSLSCSWCCNPEGIAPYCQLMYQKNACIGCLACVDACPKDAITATEEDVAGSITINRSLCRDCEGMECLSACNHDALKLSGYYMTVDELMKIIQRDRQYWGAGGGVTLSGGEPLLQFEFTAAVLKRCYDSYIHTAIETCGNVPWKHYEAVLGNIEWVFFDLKHMDSEKHKELTGVSNKLILENARKIAAFGDQRIIFRIPLIPGFNDSDENIQATAEFISKIGCGEVNILPMHNLGESKYWQLGKGYEFSGSKSPTKERMAEVKEIFEKHSIKCFVGSETPF